MEEGRGEEEEEEVIEKELMDGRDREEEMVVEYEGREVVEEDD